MQLLVCAVFYYGSVFWLILPYLKGVDMALPSNAQILKKGEDDILRFIFFLLGCYGYVISLVALAERYRAC